MIGQLEASPHQCLEEQVLVAGALVRVEGEMACMKVLPYSRRCSLAAVPEMAPSSHHVPLFCIRLSS